MVSTPADPTDPTTPTGPVSGENVLPPAPQGPTKAPQPSIAIGMSLLVIAAVLIVVVLAQPEMASWLKAVIAVIAVLVVAALLGYAVRLWMSTQKAGRKR